jgi:vacuolar-type H+-ATPase subunit E/Vma4
VSWRDLLRALDEEAAREVEALRGSAARDAARILDDARREVAAERDAALGRVRAEAESRRRRAVAEVQRDHARAVLAEQRSVLEEVRAEALERLRRGDARALPAVVDAAAREVGDAPSTWIADPASLDVVRERLARDHPRVLARAELRAAAEPRGGIEVVAGRRVLDGTAAGRLERAWPGAEPEVARILFGTTA